MTAGFTIRPCGFEDAEQVREMWNAYHAPGVSDESEDIQRLIRDFHGQLLVATNDTLIVGAIIAGWDGWRCQLHHLTVRPEYQRQGIARALVEEAEKYLKARGAKRVSVLVERDNPKAIRFYESLQDLGYTIDTWMHRFTRRI